MSKPSSMKRADRKTKIEAVVRAISAVSQEDAQYAWNRLHNELEHMAEPDAPPPRFKALLRAIWTASTNEQS